MNPYDDLLLNVHAAWNGCRNASVRFGDLGEVHWRRPAGAPQVLLHGYVSCSKLLSGAIPHVCDAATAPHRLLVCVLKRHTLDAAYGALARRADHHALRGVEYRPTTAVECR
jgi:hypothetical protein